MPVEELPLVSIVTPSYNQGQFLEATILSVLNQGYPNIEYIVIDGGSTDNSPEIIQRYADHLAYWISEKDQGQAHAINKGLRRKHGAILGWLNSDDILLPNVVSRIIDTFTENPEVDVIYGHLNRIDQSGKPVPTPLLPKDKVVFDKHTALMECVVNQPGCFWRQSVMEKIGLLNESLHYGLDYEYWMRMLLVGARFMRLDETVAEFRLSPSSKTVGQTTKMAREAIGIIDSFLKQKELADKLELNQKAIIHQANKGRGNFSLQAFYGCIKDRQWSDALYWFLRAHLYDPPALFRRKWLALATASIKRRLR